MIEQKTIEKLATLARIVVPQESMEGLAKDIESIVSYVSTITSAETASAKREKPLHRNVLRPDGAPHESGRYSAALIAAFPESLRGYLKVKKIIAQD